MFSTLWLYWGNMFAGSNSKLPSLYNSFAQHKYADRFKFTELLVNL